MDNIYGINLKDFLESIGLSNVPEDKQQEYSQRVAELLEGRIFMRLSAAVKEEEGKLMHGKSPEEVMQFLADKGVDVATLALEEAAAFKEEMAANMAYVQGLMDREG